MVEGGEPEKFTKKGEAKLSTYIYKIKPYGTGGFLVATTQDQDIGEYGNTIKNGSIAFIETSADKGITVKDELNLPYNVHGIKEEKDGKISISGSDGIRVMNIVGKEAVEYKCWEDWCQNHDSTDSLIAGGYMDGSVVTFDRATQQPAIQAKNVH